MGVMQQEQSGRRIFITVAETSADLHAANLARALVAADPTLILEGHGGEHLAAAGVAVHRNTTRRAAMGLAAVGRALEVWKLLRWTRAYQRANRPDLHICCDSWSMNRHFARLAKKQGVPVLYYLAPQVWASRPGRIAKLRRLVDRVACILPFEEEYFRRRGLAATYVGHPLFDELPANRLAPAPRTIDDDAPVVGLLPGSRKSIARTNFPRLLAVADQIRRRFPAARFLVPTTPATDAAVRALSADRADLTIRQDAFNQLVPQCDLCLTVSGTAALQVAAFGVPMLVVYYGNPLLWHLVGRWVIEARTYSLVNILSDRHDHIVPEFIPWYGSTRPVGDAAIALLERVDRRTEQRAHLLRLLDALDRPGASANAAAVALELLRSK